MSKYLRYEEFVPYASDKVDVEVHIHHCKSGKDNDRLYIRRTNDGRIVAKCHHCNQSGSYRTNIPKTFEAVRQKYRADKRAQQNNTGMSGSRPDYRGSTTEVRLPRDCEQYTNRVAWTAQARHWLSQYGLTSSEIVRAGISYSPYTNRIYFPVYYAKELSGYLSRGLDKDSPKWLAKYKQRSAFFVLYSTAPSSNRCVIVEDIVSGILCSRYDNTYVALGTYLSEEGLSRLKDYTEFLVFLDDDNPQVKMNQLKMKKQLELFGTVQIVHAGTDPKKLKESELCRVLA